MESNRKESLMSTTTVSERGSHARVTIATRRKAFAYLVMLQDKGMSVKESRERTAKRWNVTEESVEKITVEGIASQWAPLDQEGN